MKTDRRGMLDLVLSCSVVIVKGEKRAVRLGKRPFGIVSHCHLEPWSDLPIMKSGQESQSLKEIPALKLFVNLNIMLAHSNLWRNFCVCVSANKSSHYINLPSFLL